MRIAPPKETANQNDKSGGVPGPVPVSVGVVELVTDTVTVGVVGVCGDHVMIYTSL